MARTFEGTFVLADGTTTGKLNVYLVETDPGSDEPGLPQFTGWADVPTGIAGRLAVGAGEAELRLNDGRRIPILIGTMKQHSGSPLSQVTFSRRSLG